MLLLPNTMNSVNFTNSVNSNNSVNLVSLFIIDVINYFFTKIIFCVLYVIFINIYIIRMLQIHGLNNFDTISHYLYINIVSIVGSFIISICILFIYHNIIVLSGQFNNKFD